MTELTELSIREAGERIARRDVSSLELTEAVLSRIEQTESIVHAYVTVLAEAARASARKADDELARNQRRGALHGIPVAVKDLCYTTDAPTEAGSKLLRGFLAPYDATVVTKLREAGAVLVGKTVTHEFAYGQDVPPTRNAWDARCYPGGSSAGSGVSVACGSAYGAIGTDTGGSIRVPASVNGVVGLKPTFGRVSRHGVIPMSASLDHVGPLTRTVEDCALLLQAIAGFDPNDASSVKEPVDDYLANIGNGARGVRLGVDRSYFFYEHVAPDVRSAVEAAISTLEAAGATIVELTIPELELMAPVGLTLLFPDTSAFHRKFLRDPGSEYDPATRLMLELGEFISASDYVTAQRARTVLRDAVKNAYASHNLDALIAPTIPVTTMPVEQLSVELGAAGGETALSAFVRFGIGANVTGQPSLSVPCGFSRDSLPIGFQLIGRPFAEATLFRIARTYETAEPDAARRPPLAAVGLQPA